MDKASLFDGATWRKSSSSDSGGCVEVAYANGHIGVRDTKDNGSGPVLVYTEREWTAFLAGAAKGEFTLEQLA
ncbi:DUF397 domain-containing protein [Catellatospora chokoriensis]|uniref:DUF397 domain-containing protein n=1 Tax=Catellatospora chokoriensis TaxID=310353 RepID=A0A8J3JY77_9ACTN|nr:DUF397 domain-containing protein [Catellatospora chokoriensis]GIF89153.1 hypothetical protein Cch02nite_25970 [Catellatospora chokoriensis]